MILEDVCAKIFQHSEFVKTFERVRLWEPYARDGKEKKLGVITLVAEISCVVHHAKLPHLVIVAVLGFIYFLRKMKAFRTLAERRYEEIIFEWIH